MKQELKALTMQRREKALKLTRKTTVERRATEPTQPSDKRKYKAHVATQIPVLATSTT